MRKPSESVKLVLNFNTSRQEPHWLTGLLQTFICLTNQLSDRDHAYFINIVTLVGNLKVQVT